MPLVLGIDHGTTRTKAVLVDSSLRLLAEWTVPLPRRYPKPGWVEQDPMDIVNVVRQAIRGCLHHASVSPESVAGIGVANQGETVVVWERRTGVPVAPAIVWQDRRTEDLCAALAREGREDDVRHRTGLRLDSYFSAPKIRWILDHIPSGQTRAERGDLLAGTTDTWILWTLSGGHLHVTDPSTASRTLLFNIHTLSWDPFLLELFRIPPHILPTVVPTIGWHGDVSVDAPWGPCSLPVLARAVDQQAALFGHGCHHPGAAKVTYGTGAFTLMHTGTRPVLSRHGLLTTVAWHHGGRAEYALDGGVYTAGAAVQWLVDGLGVLERPEDSAAVASQVEDTGGVVVVPALAGLAAPWWDPRTRGTVFGLTLGTTRAHLVRAALEGVAWSVRDVLDAMAADSGIQLTCIRADGGPTRNETLMQIQADVLGMPVDVSGTIETTAFGIAAMAAVGGGWVPPEAVSPAASPRVRFTPRISEEERARRETLWRRAVECARNWHG